MSITIDVPPAMMQDVRLYENMSGTRIENILLSLLAKEFAKWRKAESVRCYLMAQNGWLPKDYVFDRDEANER